MRLVALSLLAALVLTSFPAQGAGEPLRLWYQSNEEGWAAIRFTTTDTDLPIAFGVNGRSELLGMTLHLYSASGTLLRGRTEFVSGGNPADAGAAVGTQRATTDGKFSVEAAVRQVATAPGDPMVCNRVCLRPTFIDTFWIPVCDLACNPSREFVLVVSAGGDNMSAYGWALFLDNYVQLASTSGEGAHVLSTRDFDSTIVTASATVAGEGVTIAQGGTLTAHAEDTFVGVVQKRGAAALQRMTIVGPSAATCTPNTCFVGKGVPGDYTFKADDVDVRGDEMFVSWADVSWP